MHALSTQSRVIGLAAAIEAGVALWYFTNGHWQSGIVFALGVVLLTVMYLRRERKSKEPDGRKRRY